jgi:hypothetical protein
MLEAPKPRKDSNSASNQALKKVKRSLLAVAEHNLQNVDFFTDEIFDMKGFRYKNPITGWITNDANKPLFASNFTNETSYRAVRCELYRNDGIFQLTEQAKLLKFLSSYYPRHNPEFLDILNEESDGFLTVHHALKCAFRKNHPHEASLLNAFTTVFPLKLDNQMALKKNSLDVSN